MGQHDATGPQCLGGEQRILAAEAGLHEGRVITLFGWAYRVRRMGALTFVLLRDRSGIIQVVFDRSAGAGCDAVDEVGVEDAITVTGAVRAEARAQGGFELVGAGLRVISRAATLPFEINLPQLKVGQDLALDHRVLSLRHPRSQAVFRIKAAIIQAFRDFSVRHGFIEVQTPKIVATATEGGANLFPVDYLGRRAYLAQSPQFYKQMLVLSGFERVFEVGPVYRAEPHNTSRHINEFTSLDWEVGWISGATEVMDLEEAMLRELVAKLRAEHAADLAVLGVDLETRMPALGGRIPRMALSDAQQLLAQRHGKQLPPGDLDPEGERLLCEALGGAVFVTDYPVETRPAYAYPHPDRPALTDSFDLLMGGIEVTTGGRRLSERAALEASLVARGLDPQAFAYYVESFGYGSPPHGGLAIGAERLTVALLGLGNLREATFFPRDIDRLTP